MRAALVAAGIALLVLGYPAYLGLVRLNETWWADEAAQRAQQVLAEAERRRQEIRKDVERRLQEIEKKGPSSGPLEITYLRESRREGLSDQTVTVRPGQQAVGLAIAPDLALIGPPDRSYRIELRHSEEVLAAWDLSGAQIRNAVQSAQAAVVLVVSATLFPEGSLEIRLTEAGKSGQEPVARFGFRSHREEPPRPRE